MAEWSERERERETERQRMSSPRVAGGVGGCSISDYQLPWLSQEQCLLLPLTRAESCNYH